MSRSRRDRMLGAILAGLAFLAITTTAWAALWPLGSGDRERVYVIPAGTSARLKAGERLSVLPPTVRLVLGVEDVLVLRNDDDARHQVGPILLGPRQTYRIPFRTPSSFQYACSLHSSGQLRIVVETAAPGWERFVWRIARIVNG